MEALAATSTPEAPEVPEAEVLGEVLASESEGVPVRASAAMLLGQLGSRKAEDALLANLSMATDTTLRARIAKALAKVGSVHSIRVLTELAQDPEPIVRSQASFSRSVIAYRLGLSGFELPVPSAPEMLEVDPSNSLPLKIEPASAEEIRATLSSLGGDTYGLMPSEEVGYRIECGPRRMVLALARDFVQRNITALAMKRYMFFGLIARRSPVDGSFSVSLLLFEWPSDEDRFYVAAHRTDGKQLLFGPGVTDSDAATFELNAVSGRGSKAVLVRGRLQGPAISITEALCSQSIAEQEAPGRMPPS